MLHDLKRVAPSVDLYEDFVQFGAKDDLERVAPIVSLYENLVQIGVNNDHRRSSRLLYISTARRYKIEALRKDLTNIFWIDRCTIA